MLHFSICGESLAWCVGILLGSVVIYTYYHIKNRRHYLDEKINKNPDWVERRRWLNFWLVVLALALIIACIAPFFIIEPPQHL